jgi:adenylate cyclase
MAGLTRDVVARRAGLDRALVDTLVDEGLLAPDAAGELSAADVRRARIVHGLELGGLPLTVLGEAVRRGELSLDFVDQPAYERFSSLTETSFRQLAERAGIPLELLLGIREAMGFAQPDPDDLVRESELVVLPMLQLLLEQGVRQAVVERMLRTYGESLRRMAESEAEMWRTDVLGPLFAAGVSAVQLGRRTAEFSNAIGEPTDEALLALYHGQQSNAWMKNIFEGFETALSRAGLHQPADRVPAICFLDLSGYTRLTEQHGDAHAAELAGRLARLVQRTSSQHGGKPVKWLGDGVMFHFRDPGPGVLAALEMVEGAKEADLPPAHVGLHAGPVLFQEGDYFGRTVNVASRIADYARQGEVLVSDDVVAASQASGVAFDPIGPVELKGLTEVVSLHVARRAS